LEGYGIAMLIDGDYDWDIVIRLDKCGADVPVEEKEAETAAWRLVPEEEAAEAKIALLESWAAKTLAVVERKEKLIALEEGGNVAAKYERQLLELPGATRDFFSRLEVLEAIAEAERLLLEAAAAAARKMTRKASATR